MADTNNKSNFSPGQPGDELEQALDRALAKYSAVEARAGLDERILAHVHLRQAELPAGVWWQWRLAGAVAVILIVAVLGWRLTRASTPAIANYPPNAIQHPSTQKTNSALHNAGEVTVAKRSPVPQRRATAATATAATPKLDQFPSPNPLSAEEIALAEYVRNFAKEAQLVAEAQREFELETEKEMNDAGSESGPSGSTQQER